MENTAYNVTNTVLDMLQMAQNTSAVKQPGTENAGGEAGSFKDMLESKSEKPQESTKAETERDTVKADTEKKPVENSKQPEKSDKKTEEAEEQGVDVARQIACSQMVMLEVPVEDVAVETAPIEAAVEVSAVEIEAQPEIVETVVQEQTTVQVEQKTEAAVEPKVEFEAAIEQETVEVPQEVDTDEYVPAEQNVQRENVENETVVREDIKVVAEEQPEIKTEDDTAMEGAAEVPVFQEVEAAPIKVAEPESEFVPQQAEDIDTQLEPKLTKALAQGESRVQVQLQPENLGVVNVEITRSRDGAISVILSAVNEQTHNMLTKHASRLQQAMLMSGQQNVQVQVQKSDDAQQAENQQNNQRNPEDMYDGQDGGQHNQRQQEQRRHNANSGQDFLQQLRLGLIPLE